MRILKKKVNKNIHLFLQIFSILGLVALFLIFEIQEVRAESVNDVILNAPDGTSLADAFNLVPVGSNSHATIAKNKNGNDVCILTDDSRNQRAALWSATNYQLDLNKDFDTKMKLYLGNKGIFAADGITFTLQNDPRGNSAFSSSTEGGSLGVYSSQNAKNSTKAAQEALQNSFSIEFDTHKNVGEGDAYDADIHNYRPGSNHIAATLPGTSDTYYAYPPNVIVQHNLLTEPINFSSGSLSNGQWHDFEVHYDHITGQITYIFDGQSRVCNLPRTVFSSDYVYWGFTGTTGDNSDVNAIVFSELPEAIDVETTTDVLKNNESVINKNVNMGDTLTYSLKATYLGGIQNWTDVVGEEFLNPYVEYIPHTLVVKYPETGTITKEEPQITAENHLIVPELTNDLGDVHENKWTSVEITFDVKVKNIDSNQKIIKAEDYTEFIGDNYTVQPYESSYQILNDEALRPQIKLSDSLANASVSVFPTDQSLTIDGEWKDKDSNTVSLYYKLNGQEKVLQDNVSNTAKDSWLPFSQEISLADLNIGDNQVEVYAKDTEGQLSNHESFKIILNQGNVSFKSIDPEIQFKNMVISGTTVYSSPQATVGVVVEDTTGIPKDWQLKVKQTTSFSDGTRDLPAQLTYLNGEEKLSINDSSAVVLPVVQNNATDYSLQQDANHQFQLAVSPGAYTGEYQSQLEWTIERVP
ncbi:lectin-like domain-containing protein [Enterococcus faecium]|uniref:lectin-like domain-containing protein n=1 Tax=Enterococcus faecium TaxID=1352 RepID=UPI000A340B5B|nr:L-type lectin-domain containing protein [Enterococcus faecium]